MNEPLTDELIDHVLQNISDDQLTEWEVGFLKSVRLYWKKSRRLSEKQKKRLQELWMELHNAKRGFKKTIALSFGLPLCREPDRRRQVFRYSADAAPR